MHFNWFSELKRVLKTGGVILITTQGEKFQTKANRGRKKKVRPRGTNRKRKRKRRT